MADKDTINNVSPECSGIEESAAARRLTDKAEMLKDVSAELNAMPVGMRVSIAHKMEHLNQADRATDPNLPALEFTFEREFEQEGYRGLANIYPKFVAKGKEHLTSVDALKDPEAWIFKGRNHVYKWPEEAEKSRPTPEYDYGLSSAERRNRAYSVDNRLSD